MSIQNNPKFNEKLDEVFEKTVSTLADIVRIPSVSVNDPDAKIIEKSAVFVESLFAAEGVKTQIAKAAKENSSELGNPAIIGYLGCGENGEIDPKKPTVLLYAHHDVQPAQFLENWDTPPFEPTILETPEGPRMYGRGAADDGAGLVSHLGALRLYQALDEPLPVNFKIFIEGEEEKGSPSFANFLQDFKEELRADLIIVADSGNWAIGVPAITTTLRGVCTINLNLQYLEHSIHSGMSSGPIIDANAQLMRIISSIWDDKGNIIVKGLLGAKNSGLPEPIEPSIDFPPGVFEKDSSLLAGMELAGEGSISGRIWNKPSVAVIGFDAVPTKQSSNVFAPSASARISLRVAPGQDPQEAATALIKHLEQNVLFNANFEAEVLEYGPSFKAEIDKPGAIAFKEALEQGFGEKVVYSGMGGSIPFTASLKDVFPDAEILLAGVEDPDSRAHSDNESVFLPDLRKVIVSFALLLEKLSK